ncbi:hypothetical protein FLA_2463 [Filimonas lacunae]|nr:hypothetical protein FLA_2463 [Filimonas lacunae]
MCICFYFLAIIVITGKSGEQKQYKTKLYSNLGQIMLR